MPRGAPVAPGATRARRRLPSQLDWAVAVVLTVGVLAGTAVADRGQGHMVALRPLGVSGYILVVAGGAVVSLRTRAPTVTLLLSLGLAVAYQALAYPGGPDPSYTVLALFSLAAHGYRVRALGYGLLASVLLIGSRAVFVPRDVTSPLLITFPTTVVAALFVGQLVATLHSRAAEAELASARAEQEREADTVRRVDGERLRIARELHDVVAHHISLINVQATMGVHMMPGRPQDAESALLAIKAASKQALRELRSILDVLRQADEPSPTEPTSGLAHVDSLVSGTGLAGLAVSLETRGRARPLPAAVDAAAFRIVQESLTNVLRHAPGARAQVRLSYEPTHLVVQVSDGGGVGGPVTADGRVGHGIPGMRERAAAVGGTLNAGPVGDGGFMVSARLPAAGDRAGPAGTEGTQRTAVGRQVLGVHP